MSRWLVRVWWLEHADARAEAAANRSERLGEFSAEPLEPVRVTVDGADAWKVGVSMVVDGRTAKVAVITALAALEGVDGVHPVALRADAV